MYNSTNLARMVELVDTLVSGTRAFTGVQVQVLFRAQIQLSRLDFFMPHEAVPKFSRVRAGSMQR